MAVITTLGVIGGYTVTVEQITKTPALFPYAIGAFNPADSEPYMQRLALTKDGTTLTAAVFPDTQDNARTAHGGAVLAGQVLLRAFAAIGGLVTLGAPGGVPLSPAGSADAETYTKAALLTPGTPLPPGRGAWIKGTGSSTILLKLANGGTMPVSDPSGGGGYQVNGFAVVDADMTGAPTGATVTILY